MNEDDGSSGGTSLRAHRAPPPSHAQAFLLRVTEGADVGAALKVDGSEPERVLVGTSPVCGLRLTDPAVSRRHLAVEVAGARLRLCDVGSTNGTRVDHVTVVEAFAEGGETVRIGDSTLRVDRVGQPAAVALPDEPCFGRMIGSSVEMRRLYPLCARLAASDVPVIIEGETGTGKELLAEALHEEGSRASGPFVVFDCTTIASSLVEAQLFGHERGAFTGAVGERRGVFEQAHGGTLFIDEIGDLELGLQAKLLRAIERGQVQRLGGSEMIRVDVRIVAATRRNLDQQVQEGRFRDDLFYRLAVARIELPPLRRRSGDVALLARHFHRAMGGQVPLLAQQLQSMESHDWPGNVRELHNHIARLIALGDSLAEASRVRAPTGSAPADFIDQLVNAHLPYTAARDRALSEFDRRYLDDVLQRHGGSVTRAAAASGLARRYFQQIKARQRA